MHTKRLKWVDYVKVIACVLVVSGHFFQSMVLAGILPETELYSWFIQTIYYFHVPLFFICSGYLYQNGRKTDSAGAWWRNARGKLLSLGVPYFTFSTATWALKTIFSGSVNSGIGSLPDTLFLHPVSPYWYLYCLFFLFLVTPTIGGKKGAWLLTAIALAGKLLSGRLRCGVYAVNYVLDHEIWFVIGMNIRFFQIPLKGKLGPALAMGTLFLAAGVAVFLQGRHGVLLSFALGLLACVAVILIVAALEEKMERCRLFDCLSAYTMPIFLMHTLFAAPVRIVLLKIGIENPMIHIAAGLVASFAGPMVAAILMKKLKYPEFFLYPGKFIKGK